MCVGFVPGVTPDKWFGRWRTRYPQTPLEGFQTDVEHQLQILRTGDADVCFVRFPVEAQDVHVIPLYAEQPVVVAAKDHEISILDTVNLAELDGPFLHPSDVGGAAMAIEVAAAGTGMVIVPMSIARLYSRRDVVFRPVSGVEETRIGLAWLVEKDSKLIEEFIGIVRGRTANSSRQPSARDTPSESSPKAASKRRSTAAKPHQGKSIGGSRKNPKSRGRGRGRHR